MEQMLTYIFSGLQKCEDNFTVIDRVFKAQNKLNKLMSFTLLFSSYATYSALKAQRVKIAELTKEVERLKGLQESVESAE